MSEQLTRQARTRILGFLNDDGPHTVKELELACEARLSDEVMEQFGEALGALIDDGKVEQAGDIVQLPARGSDARQTPDREKAEGQQGSSDDPDRTHQQDEKESDRGLFDRIQDYLLANGPSRPRDMQDAFGLDKAKLRIAMKQLEADGRVVADGATVSRTYRLPNQEPANPKPATRRTGTGASKKTRRKRQPSGDANDQVIQALEAAEKDAQAALDDYVASVCDPDKLRILRDHRDAARRALNDWRAQA